MAIIHNLSDPTDNLSGFDPAAGHSDGETIGSGWVYWKICEAMRAFDSNWKLITASSPTPTFLQAEVLGLVAEPALNFQSSTTSGAIRMYRADDPGLAAATPSAFIYHFGSASSSYYRYGMTMGLYYKVSGGSIATAFVGGAGAGNFSTFNAYYASSPQYKPYASNRAGSSTTTTTMANIAKCVFWKSSNCFMITGIDKVDNSYKGHLALFFPSNAGYRDGIGATTEGTDLAAVYGFTHDGTMGVERFSETITYSYNNVSSLLSPMCSGGIMGSALMNWSSANQLISGKLRFGLYNDTSGHLLKCISDEIEGIRIVNTSQSGLAAVGGIQTLSGKYFMTGGYMRDGRVTQRCLYELEDV